MAEVVTVREVPAGETVVMDVPPGRMRVGGDIRDGIGTMVFSISDESLETGSRPGHKPGDRDALRMVIQTPEKAEAIALAFIEMASKMRKARLDAGKEQLEDEIEEELEVEEDVEGEIIIEIDDGQECPLAGCGCRFCGGCNG